MDSSSLELAGRPRWRGQPGRLEVHYLTATDSRTGDGLWLHHEVVAPSQGAQAYAHGWLARFPVDGRPSYVRFGPSPADSRHVDAWFATDDATMTATSAVGTTAELTWSLHWTADGTAGNGPLWTFPQWAWRRNALPAAQVLPVPSAHMSGTVGGDAFEGTGATAHIYGHGNAQRWVWLHADLGHGDVLEIVAATARRAGLRRLPPLPLLQLRVNGRDWPRDPLAAAPLLRARVETDGFRIAGVVGTRRIEVEVSMPADRCVVVPYVDPDGATATCTNTARADVTVRTQRLRLGGFRDEREWHLAATGHAEIGTRP